MTERSTQAPFSRRRFMAVSAAAAGLPLMPLGAKAAGLPGPDLRVWRGVALGADAVLQIHHPDPETASRVIAMSLAEVRRLERIFSLYDPASALVRLNRDGALEAPAADLVRLLSSCIRFGELTDGTFDVTIQPLWRAYAGHFGRAGADPGGPDHAAVRQALALVDFRAIKIDAGRIRLARAGMAITCNGIAQGYITDRVVRILRREGMTSSLVDMGEICAIGRRPDGAPWTAGLEDPRAPGRIYERLELVNRAVATSGGYGLRFDPAGRFNHLLDPTSGESARRYLAVSVVAADAMTADALSTAFSFMPLERAAVVARALGATAHFFMPDGSRIGPVGA